MKDKIDKINEMKKECMDKMDLQNDEDVGLIYFIGMKRGIERVLELIEDVDTNKLKLIKDESGSIYFNREIKICELPYAHKLLHQVIKND